MQFDVSMHDSKPVHVNQSPEQPPHDLFGLFLVDSSIFVDAFKEITPCEVFSNHKNWGLWLHNMDYFDYIPMIHHP